MRIESVRIENFRCFKDETIKFDNYTCFIGPNGAGKSTVFNALNVFFRQNKDCRTDLSKLNEEDYHHKNTNLPVKITLTFVDLSEDAKTDLSDYVRYGKLIISSIAEFDKEKGYGEVKQYGSRLGMNEFRKFFAIGMAGSATELKNEYLEIRKIFSALPAPGSKQTMIDTLRAHESQHPDACVLIPSEDQFYGVSKGANKLAKYIQWVFIAASKDFSEESEESKDSALGQLLSRTVRSKVNFDVKIQTLKAETQKKYNEILEFEQSALKDISDSLGKRLAAWSHSGITAQVKWRQDSEKTVKVEEPWAFIQLSEKGFSGDLVRFGHGLQRSFMLALLQELSTIADTTSPTLVMGIEEPEIYQHPPQARYLSEILQELSEKQSQIMVCSHSPLFIPGDNFESIRIVLEKDTPPASFVSYLSYSELEKKLENSGQKPLKEKGLLAKIYSSLNPTINEMFFCKFLILTEGIEDVAYLTTYLMLSGRLSDFRRNGCHIVPAGGKSEIIKPLAMAKLLNIPVYVVCDADTDVRADRVNQHKKDNRCILDLCGLTEENEWPNKSIKHSTLMMWKTNIGSTMENVLGQEWTTCIDKACSDYGNAEGLKKNPLVIARALGLLWEKNVKSKELDELTKSIIEFSSGKTN